MCVKARLGPLPCRQNRYSVLASGDSLRQIEHPPGMVFLLLVIIAVYAFEYINGFHDAANAIATVVSTKVLTARVAVVMAAAFNLVGALSGTAVAKTVGAGLVDTNFVTSTT